LQNSSSTTNVLSNLNAKVDKDFLTWQQLRDEEFEDNSSNFHYRSPCLLSLDQTGATISYCKPDDYMRSTRKVIFPKYNGAAKLRTQKSSRPINHPHPAISSTMANAGAALYSIPSAFSAPPIRDSLITATSAAQDENIQETLPLIKASAESTRGPFEYNEYGVPRLDRLQHIDFLKDALGEHPAPFVGIDASRPWMVYWGLMGLHLLGEDVTEYRMRLVFLPSPQLYVRTGISERPTSLQLHQTVLSNYILIWNQCYQDIHTNAKRHWRFRWRTWAALTPSMLICGYP
jgi:hypothetical protein